MIVAGSIAKYVRNRWSIGSVTAPQRQDAICYFLADAEPFIHLVIRSNIRKRLLKIRVQCCLELRVQRY